MYLKIEATATASVLKKIKRGGGDLLSPQTLLIPQYMAGFLAPTGQK